MDDRKRCENASMAKKPGSAFVNGLSKPEMEVFENPLVRTPFEVLQGDPVIRNSQQLFIHIILIFHLSLEWQT